MVVYGYINISLYNDYLYIYGLYIWYSSYDYYHINTTISRTISSSYTNES